MLELTVVEREGQLVKLRKQLGRALRRGEASEFDRLQAVYASLKAEHVLKVHEEHVAQRRAVRAALRAQERVERPQRWRLPPGFGASPGAAERARQPRPAGVVQVPVGGLRPWRGRGLMETRIWRP